MNNQNFDYPPHFRKLLENYPVIEKNGVLHTLTFFMSGTELRAHYVPIIELPDNPIFMCEGFSPVKHPEMSLKENLEHLAEQMLTHLEDNELLEK